MRFDTDIFKILPTISLSIIYFMALLMTDTYLILASFAVISIVAFGVKILMAKNNNSVVELTDNFEDEDLTITLLNASNYVQESDFK